MSTQKDGLDYFPLAVDFFDDEKVQFVSARFGVKGEMVMIRLLVRIYRNGYYLKWDEDKALLFTNKCGSGFTVGLINDVVDELFKRDFLSKVVFDEYGVLTSNGIQLRFFEAVKRRKKIIVYKEYMLVDPECIHHVNILFKNVTSKAENVHILPQSKVEYSKGSKGEESKEEPPTPILIPIPEPPEKKDTTPLSGGPPPFALMELDQCFAMYLKPIYERTREQLCMSKHMDEEMLSDWALAFNRELTKRGELQKHMTDYATHFSNWLNYQDLSKNPTTLHHEQKSTKKDEKSGNGPNADYKAELARRMAGG